MDSASSKCKLNFSCGFGVVFSMFLQMEMLFLRLVTISDDSKLQVFLQKSLVDAIETMASGGDGSLEKGMEFLNQLNHRVKTNMDVKLPLSELLDYFLLPTRKIITTNFVVVYIKMGLMRVTENECINLLPKFFNAITANLEDRKISEQLLLFASRCLICSSQLPSSKWTWACYLDNKPFRLLMLQFFHNVLAFSNSSRSVIAIVNGENLQLQVANVESHSSSAPPSLTRHDYLLLAKELLLELQLSIVALKIAVLKIVSSNLFTDQERFPLLLLASANGPDEVESAADSAMRRISIDDMIGDKDVCKELLALYLGSAGMNSSDENRVAEASITLKLSLLPLFNRSHVAPLMFPANIKLNRTFIKLAYDLSILRILPTKLLINKNFSLHQAAFDGLFGKSHNIPKLKQLSASFLLAIIKSCPENSLNSIGPIMFSSLRSLLNTCKHEGIIAIAYQCLGLLGAKVPNLLLNDMHIVQEMFETLSEVCLFIYGYVVLAEFGLAYEAKATPVLASSIADCLIAWLPSFCKIKDAAGAEILQLIISTYFENGSVKCRLVALKFIETLLKTQCLGYRWTLCSAYADTHEEIKREAKRLLELSLSVPDTHWKFEDVVQFFYKKLKLATTFDVESHIEAVEVKRKKVLSNGELVTSVALYLLNYIKIFVKSTDQVSSVMDSGFVGNEDSYVDIDSTLELLDLITVLLYCTNGRLNEQRRNELIKKTLTDMISIAKQNICSASARVYVLCLKSEERSKVLQSYSTKLTSDIDEFQLLRPGEIWAISFLLSEGLTHTSAEMFNDIETGYFKYIEESFLHGSDMLEVLCCSLEQIYRRSYVTMDQIDQEKLFKGYPQKIDNLCSVLSKISLTRKDFVALNVKEAIVRCFGFLSTSFLEESICNLLIGCLFALGESASVPELQFTVGSSMFDAVLAEYSPSRRNTFTESEMKHMGWNNLISDCLPSTKLEHCDQKVLKLFDRIKEKLSDTNRHLRRAAFIWLYVLVERSCKYKLKFVNERLCDIQQAFLNGLEENDDFTQDVVSQGIGIVFNMGTSQQKCHMVAELVEFLTSGRRKLNLPITGDTVVLNKGEVRTGLGLLRSLIVVLLKVFYPKEVRYFSESLTTYKELCSLAKELNQPDLLYKFMQLANQKLMLNMKKGAAYGFSILMQEAKNDLEPYFPKIVPKLYRYRYDPDTEVMNAMRNLWKIITSSHKNVIETFLSPICKELLSSLTNPLWRVRQSSCLAMSDILMRLAAKSTLKSLCSFTLRICENEKGNSAIHLIEIVLPSLIEKGLRSSLKENRMLRHIIMDISSKAGPALQPHLTVIVPCLLESLSEIEPSWLNYLAARSDIDELEALDTARTSAARSSPMVNVLHGLIQYMDEPVIVHLCPLLVDLLKNCVGVSTRIGTAQLLVDICVRRRQMFAEIKETCDRLTNALLIGLRDRNPAIRKQFSTTLSYIIKFSSKKQINRVLSFILEKIQGEERIKSDETTSYHLLRAFADNSSEILTDSGSMVIPYIFLISSKEVQKDDEKGKKQKQLWEDLWNDIVPGTEAAIRLYKSELLEVVSNVLLNNPAWVCKAEAATMLTRILYSRAVEFSSADADDIFSKLSSLLRGKFWSGKEKVLSAIVALLQVSGDVLKSYWKTHEERCEKFSVIWKECLKKKFSYCVEAIFCASWFCQTFEILKETRDLLHLIEIKGFEQAESSSDSETENRSLRATIRVKAMNCLFSALPHCVIALQNDESLSCAVDICLRVLDANDLFWKAKIGLIVELGSLIPRFAKHVNGTKILYSLISLVNLYWDTQNSFSRQCLQVVNDILNKATTGNILLDDEDLIERLSEFKETAPSRSSWATAKVKVGLIYLTGQRTRSERQLRLPRHSILSHANVSFCFRDWQR
uniref:Integrator complex subunit 7 n=1 Tax=Syphacia muris TaxID=451379 RepID=A0A0N5A806_9BILA